MASPTAVPSRSEVIDLLHRCKEEPDDDTPRLILADWLEEHGDPRGEFIRVQCALDKIMPLGYRPSNPKLARPQKRQKELLAAHQAEWLEPFCQAAEACGARLMQRVPANVTRFVRWGFTRGLFRLAIDAKSLVSEPVKALAGTETWAWVEQLIVRKAFGSVVKQLAKSPLWAGISYLEFEDCNLGPAGAKALAQVRTFTHLKTLLLDGDNIGDQGAKALAKARWLGAIERLHLGSNGIRDQGAAALAAAPFARLFVLNLLDNRIGAKGTKALAKSGHLTDLTMLDLSDNPIGDEGAKALASSPHLAKLQWLVLRNCAITDIGGMKLATSPHLSRKLELDLYDNAISDSEDDLRRRYGNHVNIGGGDYCDDIME